MTASALDRVIEAVLGKPYVEYLLVQGPGGTIVASAGDPPPWAPDGAGVDAEGSRILLEAGGGPDATLEVGLTHVLHLEVDEEPGDEERDRIRALLATAL